MQKQRVTVLAQCPPQYNTIANNPYKESHHPFYEPLEKIPDSAIKEMGSKLFEAGTDFWDPSNDETVGTGKDQ